VKRRERQVQRTDLLRLAIANDNETLDPHIYIGLRADETEANIYDTLMWWPLTARGYRYPIPAPNLATRVRISRNRRQFLFTINPNKRFASGNPITADDIVWSFQRLGQTGLGQFYFGVTSVDPDDPIQKVNESTLRISTSAPSSFLLQVLSAANLAVVERAAFEQVPRPTINGHPSGQARTRPEAGHMYTRRVLPAPRSP
jgi:peptide/nickel transport system substrate-binding protein